MTAMAMTAATTIPTATAVPLSAQSASHSIRDMPAVAASSATTAQTKPMPQMTSALLLRAADSGLRGARLHAQQRLDLAVELGNQIQGGQQAEQDAREAQVI